MTTLSERAERAAETARDPWREAIERWFIGWHRLPDWNADPWPQINAMIAWEQSVALDPEVSEKTRALIAAVGAAPAAEAVTGRDEWQPIETAPMGEDGDLVWLWGSHGDRRPGRVIGFWFMEHWRVRFDVDMCEDGTWGFFKPTHWQPLPDHFATIPAPRPAVAEVGASVEGVDHG